MKEQFDFPMSVGYDAWRKGDFVTLTFCVTEDCNLACKYCYMTGKNNKHVMDYETAKEIVDFVLQDEYINSITNSVAFDFIGGEPLLEIDMIDKLCDYIVTKLYITNHKWFSNYYFSFSTNGTLYDSPKVTEFIKKHEAHCWMGISVDGTKEKHDLSRVKKDGTGSYDDVVKNVGKWLNDFSDPATKSTFSTEDLPFLKDSIIHLWDLGIKNVMSNLVYEDVWREGDDLVFEEQLKGLADYIIEHELWHDYTVSYFEATHGLPLSTEDLLKNRCGAGYKSLAFDSSGNIYPCIHFLDMCIPDKDKFIIGTVKNGVNKDYVRALSGCNWLSVSNDKCKECEVGYNCGWCLALNYQESKNNSLYERTTHLCNMHKANVRANDYFWKKYEEKTGQTSPRTIAKISKKNINALKYLLVITSDNVVPHCSYKNELNSSSTMSKELLNKALRFCADEQIVPIFLGSYDHGLDYNMKHFFEISETQSVTANSAKIDLYNDTSKILVNSGKISILVCLKNDVGRIHEKVESLLHNYDRVNVFIQDYDEWDTNTLILYKKDVGIMAEILYKYYASNEKKQINILSDLISQPQQKGDCGAGITTISLAPDGNFYICPAFYLSGAFKDNSIGNIETGIDKSKLLFCHRNQSPVCSGCEINNCGRCLYLNKRLTKELQIPSGIQCKASYIQANVAYELQTKLISQGFLAGDILSIQPKKYVDFLHKQISQDVFGFEITTSDL